MINNRILSISLIFISVIPIWLFEDLKNLNFEIVLISSLYVLLFLTIYFSFKNYKKINLIFLSIIIFYGVDNKIGFWLFFKDFFSFDNKLYYGNFVNYLFSLAFVILCIYLIYKLISKNFRTTQKFFLFTISLILVFNVSINYIFNFKYKTPKEFYENEINHNQNKVLKKNKLLILYLDEMVGYGGIDKDIKYGTEAKKSILYLYNNYDFQGFLNAYSIYRNTKNAIPALLNFDYNQKNYKGKNYFSENILDKYTKWSLLENEFFKKFSEKKIITIKNRALDFCSKDVTSCLRLNNLNLNNTYVKNFQFSSFDFFIKKMKKQKSILFQYFWRLLHEFNLTNDYVDFVFDKVNFENNLKYLSKILLQSEFDLYFFHYLFPHSPMALNINEDNKCVFSKKTLTQSFFKDREKRLSQHYKEIICTNRYLDKFLGNLKKNKILENLDILILSDTGHQIPFNKDKKTFIKDAHSVFFAIKSKKTKIQHSDEFVSSQELFSRHFNRLHKTSDVPTKVFKVFDIEENSFVKIDNFRN